MGGMRWGSGDYSSEDYCRLIGVPHRTFTAEETMPAPLVHVGPRIVTTPPRAARAGTEYVYQAVARDAAVNGFTWSFKKSPPGMAIDRYTGKITWTPESCCRVDVEICAYTHHGHRALQAWTLSVAKAVRVRAFVPNPRFIEALRRKRLRAAGQSQITAAVRTQPYPPSRSHFIAVPRASGPAMEASPIPATTATTGPPFRGLWRGAGRTACPACRTVAPPGRHPGAGAVPLRL